MQVNLRPEVWERGRSMLQYGQSWSDLVESLMDYYENGEIGHLGGTGVTEELRPCPRKRW